MPNITHPASHHARAVAQFDSERTYQGAPCKRGHLGVRYTSTKACVHCTQSEGATRKQGRRSEERERLRAWKHANPEAHANMRRNNRGRFRAKCKGLPYDATTADVRALFDAQGGCCAYCGARAAHLDHKTPIRRAGGHTPSNLQWLCGFHNLSKCNATDGEYRTKHGIPAFTPWDAF